MRRRTVLLSMAASLLGACGYGEAPAGAAGTRTLIVYYSWSGNTRAAAERIRELTGGTAEAIRPVKPYPEDYAACVELAKGECRTETTPAIAALEADPADYDVIFVGSPNWWGTVAPPVRTFLKQYDLSGKTVIPFFTHGGGGLQRCEATVRGLCPSSELRKAGAFPGSRIGTSGGAIAEWVGQVTGGAR